MVSSQNTFHTKKNYVRENLGNLEEEITNMKLCLTKEMAKMTLDLKEEITKMWLDMGDQFQHLIASINWLKEGFRSLREELNTCQRDHNFKKTK